MLTAISEFIDRSHDAASPQVLKDQFLAAIASKGFENAVFARVRHRRLESIPWSQFPDGYLANYQAEQWDRIDPVVQKIQSARRPFRWSQLLSPADLTKRQRSFFEDCRDLGVHSGITIPIRGGPGETDLISLSLRERSAVLDDDLSDAYAMSLQYWLKYRELSAPKMGLAPFRLTGRETEILSWCKEGKTNWEIGEILALSEKTIEFHLGNAMRKLGAANRMTAVITGIKRGLIHL